MSVLKEDEEDVREFLTACWRFAARECFKQRKFRSAATALFYGLYGRVPVPTRWPNGVELVKIEEETFERSGT